MRALRSRSQQLRPRHCRIAQRQRRIGEAAGQDHEPSGVAAPRGKIALDGCCSVIKPESGSVIAAHGVSVQSIVDFDRRIPVSSSRPSISWVTEGGPGQFLAGVGEHFVMGSKMSRATGCGASPNLVLLSPWCWIEHPSVGKKEAVAMPRTVGIVPAGENWPVWVVELGVVPEPIHSVVRRRRFPSGVPPATRTRPSFKVVIEGWTAAQPTTRPASALP